MGKSWTGRAAMLLLCMLALTPVAVSGQQVLTQPERTVTVGRGTSALITMRAAAERVSIGDPEVADALVISPLEIVVNGITVGTTSLFVWDETGRVSLFTIEVTPDIAALDREIRTLFPDAAVRISATGESVVVSGTVRDPLVARRILEIVRTTGVTVINNLNAPSAHQILLHVRFAEVNRTAVKELGSDLLAGNAQDYPDIQEIGTLNIETLSEGLVRLFLLGDNGASLEAVFNALRSRGHFKSLAEPNLLAMEGQEASFLAGGEFPYPSVQGGSNNQVTIVWKEFGIKLNFVPHVTNDGSIRLSVAPEVSSLDFSNGLEFAGFRIPLVLTRRAGTEVELDPGQHLAIAGLLDNQQEWNRDEIPILGQLPIIGTFFGSTRQTDRQTELLVVVTPYIVEATDQAPGLPTGEPATWPRPDVLNDTTVRPPLGRQVVDPSGGGE